jgi:hypothetical protein
MDGLTGFSAVEDSYRWAERRCHPRPTLPSYSMASFFAG